MFRRSRIARTPVLLVSLDCVRPDSLSCYKLHARARSPWCDWLAQHGARWERAYSHAPHTPAAHASMLTGLLPPRHGIRIISGQRLQPQAGTLAEHLHAAGYRTAAFVGSHALHRAYGLDRGFERYDDEFRRGRRNWHLGSRRDAPEVTRNAERWLQGVPRGQPWFLFVHYFDAHDEGEKPSFERQRAAVRRLDRHVGQLLRAVARKWPIEGVLVIVTSDHGDTYDEHEEWGHREYLFDTTLRVPLLISGPAIPPVAQPGPAAHVDLLPTVLEATGLAVPDGLDGASLLRPLDPRRVIYAETSVEREPGRWEELRRELSCVRRGAWKLVREEGSGAVRLYEMGADPLERRDRAGDEPALVAELLEELEAVRHRAVAPTPFAAGTSGAVHAAMRELGYLT